MKILVEHTTAYKAYLRDIKGERVSHAYLLRFDDEANMRAVLKLFALAFFGESENTVDGARILEESFTDLKVVPPADKKITVESISAIIEDGALKPVEREKKLFIISGLDTASPLVQNKLLKILEEPPAGVYFLLGATSLSAILSTVISRVKILDIPPFSEEEIYLALRRKGENPENRGAAAACGGVLGIAENMVSGGWFKEVQIAAKEIYEAQTVEKIARISSKYGDTKYKKELLSCLNGLYFDSLKNYGTDCVWQRGTLVFALEKLVSASADLKFNAYFGGLLYEFMLSVIKENDRWLKLQA